MLNRYGVANPIQFGARGGAYNDREALQAAVDHLPPTDGILFFPFEKMSVGDLTTNTEKAIQIKGKRRLIIEMNGCVLSTQTTAQVITHLLWLEDCHDVTIISARGKDTGLDLNVDWKGAYFLGLYGCTNVRLIDCHAESVLGFVRSVEHPSIRSKGLELVGCGVDTAYYGLNLQEDGDDLRGSLRTHNVRRPYFCYGVTNHDLDLTVDNDANGLGSSAAVLIKSYTRNTSGIRIRTAIKGTRKHSTGVRLECQADTARKIDAVQLYLSLAGLDDPSGLVPFRIKAYSEAAVAQNPTDHQFDRIHFAGDLAGHVPATNTDILEIESVPNTIGHISFDPFLRAWRRAVSRHPGFIERTPGGQEVQTVFGNLTTATVKIPLAALDQTTFALRVTVHAHDDLAALAAQNSTTQEVLIIGYNGGGGPVVIQSTTVLHTVDRGTGATITYTANGEDIDVTFAGAPYAVAGANARVMVEHLGRY